MIGELHRRSGRHALASPPHIESDEVMPRTHPPLPPLPFLESLELTVPVQYKSGREDCWLRVGGLARPFPRSSDSYFQGALCHCGNWMTIYHPEKSQPVCLSASGGPGTVRTYPLFARSCVHHPSSRHASRPVAIDTELRDRSAHDVCPLFSSPPR